MSSPVYTDDHPLPRYRLLRIAQSDVVTLGILIGPGGLPVCCTLEKPWRNNDTDVSCIPAGTYEAVRFDSHHFGYDLFQLDNVPHRTGVELHIGNTVDDIDGCVVLGMSFGTLNGKSAVLSSGTALTRFMNGLEGIDRIQLVVIDVPAELKAA